MRGNQSIVVIDPQQVDDHGDPIGGAPTEHDLYGCVVYPHTTSEESGRSGTVTEGYTVICGPTELTITAQHRVRHLGKVWDIDGEPAVWPYLDGSVAGVQFELTRGMG
jgi:hypothetical protein